MGDSAVRGVEADCLIFAIFLLTKASNSACSSGGSPTKRVLKFSKPIARRALVRAIANASSNSSPAHRHCSPSSKKSKRPQSLLGFKLLSHKPLTSRLSPKPSPPLPIRTSAHILTKTFGFFSSVLKACSFAIAPISLPAPPSFKNLFFFLLFLFASLLSLSNKVISFIGR